jgi:inosose dehydratase
MAKFRCSVHQITWGAENLIQALDDIHDFGYRGMETFAYVVDEFAGREDQLKSMLDERDLQLSGLYGGGPMHDASSETEVVDFNLKVAKFLERMGSHHLVLGPGRRPDGGPSSAEMRQMARVVTTIAEGARDMGVAVGVHPHWNTVVQNRNEITDFFDQVDTSLVKMVLDPAHIAKAGDDPVEVAETYADIIVYAHMKNYLPELDTPEATVPHEGLAPTLAFFSELDRGTVDIVAMIAALRKADFDGWLTVELDRTQTTPRQSLEVNTRFMTEVLGFDVASENSQAPGVRPRT